MSRYQQSLVVEAEPETGRGTPYELESSHCRAMKPDTRRDTP